MDCNLLLEWMSERGDGTWHQFRGAHAWLLTRSGGNEEEVPAGRTLERLARLGHVESARVESRWAVAPPIVTVVPGASVHAVVIGARTRLLQATLREYIDASQNLDLVARAQNDSPDALYISCSDERELEMLSARLGGHYEYSVSERISQLLPPLMSLLIAVAAPPPTLGYGVSLWQPDTNRFQPTPRTDRPGLYRYEVYGTPQFRYTPDGQQYADVDLSTGRYAELHRLGRDVLLYLREAINGVMMVPARADLPALHARSAILCSGLLPEFDRLTTSLKYKNVPLTIASRIAESLEQNLKLGKEA